MNSFYPDDPKKLKTRIQTYERDLLRDKRDGYGKRYLLGPMYLLLADIEGALKHFAWFNKNYPGDMGDPHQYLCWTLVLYRAKQFADAAFKFRETMLRNLYLIPFMLGNSPKELDIWHSSNLCELQYAQEIPNELLRLWSPEEKKWATDMWNDPLTVQFRDYYIDIEKRLKDLKPGPERSRLVRESFRLREGVLSLRGVE